MQCRVQGCRHPGSHVTQGHVCGICGQRGHGQIECGYPQRITALGCHTEVLGLWESCSVPGCTSRQFHRLEGHPCRHCGEFGHDDRVCIEWMPPGGQGMVEDVSLQNISYQITDTQMVLAVYAGMGCVMYMDRPAPDGRMRGFFLHSDLQGQYGEGETYNHLHALEAFIAGRRVVDFAPHNGPTDAQAVRCPICRVESQIPSSQKRVYGVQEKCIICQDRVVEVYLPACGHTCVCSKCCAQL